MIYLSEKDIVKLNVIQIKKCSPKEIIGTIDKNALSMAVNQLKQHIFGGALYTDEISKSAVLLIRNIHFKMQTQTYRISNSICFSQAKWLFAKNGKSESCRICS